VYDSWGKLVSITGGSGENVTDNTSHIGYINPLRYRSYYYDTETELYYLNARYYDPETGRFINSDDNFEGGLNLFAYCYNNPVMFFDPSGDIAIVDDVVVVTLVGGAALTMATANYYQWLASAEGQKAMNDGAKANAAKWVGDKTKEALDNVLMFAKGGKQNIKDTGLSGLSDSELESKYKDPNTSKLDKQKIKKEQKARKTRHSGQKK
jgi:RHS repeat-associated protein